MALEGSCGLGEDLNAMMNFGGVSFAKSQRLTVGRRVVAMNNQGFGISFSTASSTEGGYQWLRDATAVGNGANNSEPGISVDGSSVQLSGAVTADNNGDGLQVDGTFHVIRDALAFNNVQSGLVLVTASGDVTLLNGKAINNGSYGVEIGRGAHVVIDVTSINSGLSGASFDANAVGADTVMNLASVYSGDHGIATNGLTDTVFANIAATDSVGDDLNGVSAEHLYTGVLRVTDNTECAVLGSSPGIGSDCSTQDGSDATVAFGSAAGALVGRITTDDAANGADTMGSADHDAIDDWTRFDQPTRGWGLDGTSFPDHVGNCASGDTCRIWDVGLASGAATLLGVLSAPADGNAILTHTWNVASLTNCDAIPGAVFDSGSSTCVSTFLRNAYERFDDGIGNENGLCESDETCIVTPNIGAYQGHGSLTSAGSIGTGGAVENVTLMQWDTNGY